MKLLAPTLIALVLLGGSSPLLARRDEPVPEDKQKAKEARIQEYLKAKEERLAAKEAQRREREAQKAGEPGAEPHQAATAGAAAAGAATATGEPHAAPHAAPAAKLPKDLALAQDAVRKSSIGSDPTIQRYLDLIDRQEADAYQLAAFGNFLADAGMLAEAQLYYSVALGLQKSDPVLWVNSGLLERRAGRLSQAESAFSKALSLDPNNALAHYNLGTVYDDERRYDDAIEAYTVALTLDPSLGDPAVNPQAANNQRLLAVRLSLYKQQTGSLGTPLVQVPEGELPREQKHE
ncbi:MAG TPA: tetratricopeptide repeat protein [Planctomycetota bacterium]|nr:tetratricopeptide repeat protein [Planctomycetota bacterium]